MHRSAILDVRYVLHIYTEWPFNIPPSYANEREFGRHLAEISSKSVRNKCETFLISIVSVAVSLAFTFNIWKRSDEKLIALLNIYFLLFSTRNFEWKQIKFRESYKSLEEQIIYDELCVTLFSIMILYIVY